MFLRRYGVGVGKAREEAGVITRSVTVSLRLLVHQRSCTPYLYGKPAIIIAAIKNFLIFIPCVFGLARPFFSFKFFFSKIKKFRVHRRNPRLCFANASQERGRPCTSHCINALVNDTSSTRLQHIVLQPLRTQGKFPVRVGWCLVGFDAALSGWMS